MDDEQVRADVVASIVEKVLMNMGLITYDKISEILESHNVKFSDCYQHPDVLNFALKELFEDAYLVVVEKIRTEFGTLVNDDHNLFVFMQKLSEK